MFTIYATALNVTCQRFLSVADSSAISMHTLSQKKHKLWP